jgi:hypothetical protein
MSIPVCGRPSWSLAMGPRGKACISAYVKAKQKEKAQCFSFGSAVKGGHITGAIDPLPASLLSSES